MADPGILSSQIPPSEDWLVRKVADLERAVRELAPSVAKSFAPVIADLTAKQAAITVNVASIAANVASINTLISQVVKAQAVSFSGTHSLTPTNQVMTSTTITVPAGFTSAVVTGTGFVSGQNPNTTGGVDGVGGDFLYSAIRINGGIVGNGATGFAPRNGGWGTSISTVSNVLTGLTPGGTFSLDLFASTDFFTWPLGGFSSVSGTILWLR
jgi:hypothetical protein